MSSSDGNGGWIFVIAIAAGAWWAYDHWWNKEDPPKEPPSIDASISTPAVSVVRPGGEILVTRLKEGSEWKLDADSVKGPRNKRLGWLVMDHSKNKTTKYRTSKELWLVDCETDAYRILSSVSYLANGESGASYDKNAGDVDASYAIPGSNGAAVFNALCSTVFDPA